MNYLTTSLVLLLIILSAEFAIITHTKFYMAIALKTENRVKNPSLIRPIWRLGFYGGYLLAGLVATKYSEYRIIAIAAAVGAMIALISHDLVALRRGWPK